MIDTTAAHPPPARLSGRGDISARGETVALALGCVKRQNKTSAMYGGGTARETKRIHIGRWRKKIPEAMSLKATARKECPFSPSSALPSPILPSSFRFDCPINYSPELDPGAFGGNKQAANFDTTGPRKREEGAKGGPNSISYDGHGIIEKPALNFGSR